MLSKEKVVENLTYFFKNILLLMRHVFYIINLLKMADETWLKKWGNESVVNNWTGLLKGALTENLEKKEWSYEVTKLDGNEFRYDEKMADEADIVFVYRDNGTFWNFRKSPRSFISQWIKCYSVVFLYWSNVSNVWQLQDFINKYSWNKLIMTDETVWNWSGINTEKLELNPLNVSDRESPEFKKQFDLFLSQIEEINKKCTEKWIKDIVLAAFDRRLKNCHLLGHSGVCEKEDGSFYFWINCPDRSSNEETFKDAIRFWMNRFPGKRVIVGRTGDYDDDWNCDIINLDWTKIEWLDNALVITDRHHKVLPKLQSIEIAWASFEPGLANFLWEDSGLTRIKDLTLNDSCDVLVNRVLDKYRNFRDWEK